MSGDYSRKTFKANHNYSGVLMQQGRVHLDADWNEQIEINLRRQRAETVDTIGRAVVPMETPDGFKVELNAGELSIHLGRFYLDGLLVENHGAEPNQFYHVLDETRGTQAVLYQDQPYFPNAQLIEPLPSTGTHIAYLVAWQRELTYVQEPGLVEPAVGVDTTTRWQTVWQVKVLEFDPGANIGLECGDQVNAWDDLIAPSAGQLTTEIVEPQEEDDVCLVPTEGGYRALENRLYRVEVHDGGGFGTATFKWARHNASIETAVNEINGTELLVAQSQWDQERAFKQDDWVEITDDVRELAGLPGEIRRVADVEVESNRITLDTALPAADFPALTVGERHTRIKRWDQQNEVDETTGLLTVENTPFYIESGIQINFSLDADPALSGDFKTGDYWLFYARSATASIEILDQAPPRGIHRHYARLAVLNFPDDQDDCRIHWPPNFGNSCCCTITVGDGENSHGEVDSIQQAIDQLPIGGGKICLLPGVYQESVSIQGKTDITIAGCGKRTRLLSREGSDFVSEPVVRIENSRGIRIESLAIESNQSGEGVLIHETEQIQDDFATRFRIADITLDGLIINSGTASAIRCDTGANIRIHSCDITMRDVQTEWPGIFAIGDQLLIDSNTVTTVPASDASGAPVNVINAGRGGIQVGGNSTHVRVLNNTIERGRGDGITLGSLVVVDREEVVITAVLAMIRVFEEDCEPCSPPPTRIPTVPPRFELDDSGNPNPNPPVVLSAGALTDVIIENNRITDMGRNGVGVVGFFDLEEADEFISIENLLIAQNYIATCLNRTLPTIDADMEDDVGYGGIALADVLNLVVHDNQILDNGSSPFDPICGIYVLHGEGVEICDNRILNNGVKPNDDNGDQRRGARSGIHLVYAITPTIPLYPQRADQSYPRQNGVPAAKLHNNIVSQPAGRALSINALGPVVVTDNQLTSRGILESQASATASAVAIMNLGVSNEFYLQLGSFSALARGQVNTASMTNGVTELASEGVSLSQSGLDDFKLGRYLANGNVLFADNQVVLDELDNQSKTGLSATIIISLDDISFHNNQCDYSLFGDFLMLPNLLIAPSIRMADNRFKESFAGALISAVSLGIMNTTTDNQSTHCLIAIGNPGLRAVNNNIQLWDTVMAGPSGNLNDNVSCAGIRQSIGKAFNIGEDRI